ncbi:phosphate/phosphite/phosphonate ABC transporter substrate-binding protein [Roseateles albus]|uniref:Phosphate/phosphite/phosphonate ABC transporter substrate-binding protein n=1 Tax=Roseateles albus TaxID=2987525 RepID=A0ABT5KE05_9BURK|nr:phosphate/phosphite/phosphonate ABC transporter substrate-binding protein [Roseateles albus]MDC8772167.1 phosphate/phosphite/phosphonate ABC transporter substrate-binding protein [Roseateles albus]
MEKCKLARHRRSALTLALQLCGLLLGGFAAGPLRAQAAPEKPSYSVYIVPQFQAAEIQRIWAPLLEKLGQEAGLQLTLKLVKDIPAFEAELASGRPDFAYMNPYHQLLAHAAQGYRPLLRDSKMLKGLLLVRKDDPIKSVQDLQGKELAFPAPNALGASLLIRAQLAEGEGVQIKPIYAKTHSNAYRLTLVGKTAASGGLRGTLDKEPEAVQAGLRVLMETQGAAPHPFSAHPRVPAAQAQAVAAAMLKMSADPALQALFKDIPMAKPVAADFERDYRPLAKLRLEKYLSQDSD